MEENLTSTYSYQGNAPKIPWNRPLSKFKVKFRSYWGHTGVILSKLKTFVMRKISQFGSTIKRDLEIVFIWHYLVIYQQYYLPLPPYIFSQNQAMVFIIPDSPVRGSFIIDEGTGPWFLMKTQNKPIYSITNISMANMAEDNFPIPSSFRFSSSYSFILSTFWKFIQSRDPRTTSISLKYPLNGPLIPSKVLPIPHCLHVLYQWRSLNALTWFSCTILWFLSNYSSNEDPAG